MSEAYIEGHFDAVLSHASDVEQRLDDSDCTRQLLLEENARSIAKCREYGLDVYVIDSEYSLPTGCETACKVKSKYTSTGSCKSGSQRKLEV